MLIRRRTRLQASTARQRGSDRHRQSFPTLSVRLSDKPRATTVAFAEEGPRHLLGLGVAALPATRPFVPRMLTTDTETLRSRLSNGSSRTRVLRPGPTKFTKWLERDARLRNCAKSTTTATADVPTHKQGGQRRAVSPRW